MTYTILGVAASVILMPVAFTFFIAHRVTKGFLPEDKFIDIDDDRAHYTDRGTGPAIMFVHDLCGNLRNFAHLDLDRLTHSHRVIVIGWPGARRSVRGGDSLASVYTQTRTVTQYVKQLGLNKLILVGHSPGRATSPAMGLNHPHVIRQLTLITPLMHAEGTPSGALKGLVLASSLIHRLVSRTLAIPLSIVNSRKTIAAVFTPEAMLKDFPFKGGGLLGLCPRVFYVALLDLAAVLEDLPDMERRYASMTAPVDVLYGRGDRVLNVKRQGEALKQKLDRMNLYIIDGGHTLPVTQPVLATDWALVVVAGVPVEAEVLV